jgi:crotonobetainyl-CoA:carnitine CoA-transferase CaiB-like acyl-CoA transferase
MTTNALPLSRYTVLDLTIARAGPTAVRLLADWGARVIRIEPPPKQSAGNITGALRRSADEQNLHRNKRSLCIDLKHPQGLALLQTLVKKADVVVENFRADVKTRLGLDYEQLKAINPRIILASISGFGQSGPYRDRPGVDQIVQGLAGLMSITGEPGRGPMRAGIAVSDTSAGMFLGQGILQGARYTMSGEVAGQQGNFHPTAVPMGVYEANDGLVNVAASTQKMWAALCKVLAGDDLFNDPDYVDVRSRVKHKQRLNVDVNTLTRRFSSAELVEKLNAVGVPCGPINDIGQAFEDPQTQHLRMTRAAPHPVLGEVKLVRSPINLSAFPHPEAFHHAAPDAGEQTRELLQEFGLDTPTIEQLKEQGAIA